MKESVLKELELLFDNYPELVDCEIDIISAFGAMRACYVQGGLIMTCGNGGSAADAEHIVGELMKGFKIERLLSDKQRQVLKKMFPEDAQYLAMHLQQAIPAISLNSQISISSAYSNDVKADMVFAQQVLGYGKPGDVLIGLSTSGNSVNVLNACKVAKAFEVKTISLTGKDGGKIKNICDFTICVPSSDTHRVQEYHLPIYHTLCAMLELDVFGL